MEGTRHRSWACHQSSVLYPPALGHRGTLTQDENAVENNVCLRPMSIPRQTEGMAVLTSPLHRCQACHYFANGGGTLRFVTFRTLPRGFRHSESHGTRQWVLGQGLSVTVTLTWTCVPTQAADRSILTSLGGTAGALKHVLFSVSAHSFWVCCM